MNELILFGPWALWALTRAPEWEIALDQMRIHERQECLMAEHRVRVRAGVHTDPWWPFATRPLEAQEDGFRCPE